MTPAWAAAVNEEQVRQLAQVAGMRIAPEHMAGVIRNLDILLAEAAVLMAPPLDPMVEPAPVYRP